MKLIFIGASKFGQKCLEEILLIQHVDVKGIITTGENIYVSAKKSITKNVHFSNFNEVAIKNKIPLITVEGSMNEENTVQFIRTIQPQLIIVVGWYKIVPANILDIPTLGTIGIHAGMLPYYKGGSPLVWAMINGEREAGVCLFYLTDKLDAGDIIEQRKIPIKFNDDIGVLYERMEKTGVQMLVNQIPKIFGRVAARVIQKKVDAEERCVWPSRIPEDGMIDWKLNSLDLYNFIRAQTKPYPGAFSYYSGVKIYVWKAVLYNVDVEKKGKSGEILEYINEKYLKGILVAVSYYDCPLVITNFTYRGEVYQDDKIVFERPLNIGERLT